METLTELVEKVTAELKSRDIITGFNSFSKCASSWGTSYYMHLDHGVKIRVSDHSTGFYRITTEFQFEVGTDIKRKVDRIERIFFPERYEEVIIMEARTIWCSVQKLHKFENYKATGREETKKSGKHCIEIEIMQPKAVWKRK